MYSNEIDSYVINIAGLNLSMTSYPISCLIQSINTGDTYCQFLEVEYKKKI